MVDDGTKIKDLTFLSKLIGEFKGEVTEYYDFVVNCDNAVRIAHSSVPLLTIIHSNLSSSVKSRIRGKVFNSWTELKEALDVFYLDRKNYVQLMEEMNNIRQNPKESVIDFYNRINSTRIRILSTLSTSENTRNAGKIEIIEESALSRFIYHSLPEISRFLRCQTLENLLQALNKAEEEEQFLKVGSQRVAPKKWCDQCKMSNHDSIECTKQKFTNKNINFNTFQPETSNICNQSQFMHQFDPSQNMNALPNTPQQPSPSNTFSYSNVHPNFFQSPNPTFNRYQNYPYNSNYPSPNYNPNFQAQPNPSLVPQPNFRYENQNPNSQNYQANPGQQAQKKFCIFCNMHNHDANNCFKLINLQKKNQQNFNAPQNYSQSQSQNSFQYNNSNGYNNSNVSGTSKGYSPHKFCDIHKIKGHTTEECSRNPANNRFRDQKSNPPQSNVHVCTEESLN